MYKLPEQLLIENPINRYVISSATKGLKYNYDAAAGFFIPNDRKKYSVGENAGMRLDEDGGSAGLLFHLP